MTAVFKRFTVLSFLFHRNFIAWMPCSHLRWMLDYYLLIIIHLFFCFVTFS